MTLYITIFSDEMDEEISDDDDDDLLSDLFSTADWEVTIIQDKYFQFGGRQ